MKCKDNSNLNLIPKKNLSCSKTQISKVYSRNYKIPYLYKILNPMNLKNKINPPINKIYKLYISQIQIKLLYLKVKN